MKKVLALSLALMMVLALVLTGCGGSGNQTTTAAAAATTAAAAGNKTTAAATTAAPADETVVLHWYARQAGDKDWPLVEEEYNKKFLEDINATVEWHNFQNADYDQKATAAMSAQQPMDVVFTSASQLRFLTWQKAGAFMPLNDLLKEYAAETYEAIPQYVWDGATVAGQIYGMPTYKDMSVDMGFIYNQTLAQELGIEEKILNSGYTYGKDLDAVFYEGKELRDAAHPEWASNYFVSHRQDMHIYYHADTLTSIATAAIEGSFLNDGELAEGKKIFNVYATNEYADGIKLITRWVDDNIFPFDPQNADPEAVIKKSGATIGAFTWGTAVPNVDQYENWKQWIIHPTHSFTYTGYIQAVMNAIAAHSENPEKAMQALNLMFSDPVYSTMWRFGVEGVHWNRVEKDGVTRADFTGTKNDVPNKSDRPFYYWYHAELGNLFTCYLPTDLDGAVFTELEKMNENAIASYYMGFVADITPVENEVAACAGVVAEYHDTLKFGMTPNVDEQIAAFNEKLNANGAEKIVADVQAQADAWAAENR